MPFGSPSDPRGRNVVLEKKSYGAPDIVNDGDTIARDIELADPFENHWRQADPTGGVQDQGQSWGWHHHRHRARPGHGRARGLRNTAAGASPVELRRGHGESCWLQIGAEPVAKRSQAVER